MNFGGDEQAPLDEQTVLDRASAVVRRRADSPIFVRGDAGADFIVGNARRLAVAKTGRCESGGTCHRYA